MAQRPLMTFHVALLGHASQRRTPTKRHKSGNRYPNATKHGLGRNTHPRPYMIENRASPIAASLVHRDVETRSALILLGTDDQCGDNRQDKANRTGCNKTDETRIDTGRVDEAWEAQRT